MSSFITDIVEVTDNQQKFIPNSQEVNAQSLANYMPNGKITDAKNIDGSRIRNMLRSFALELTRMENVLKTVADEYYPFLTTDFMEEWEKALRIPDDCFKVDGVSLDQRRLQIVAKLAIDKIINKDDFIALAKFFGYIITIQTGFAASQFPATFPITLSGPSKIQKFTMIVTFHGIAPSTGFPYTFQFTFPADDPTEFLECLIVKLSPAHVNVIFKSQA